MLEKSGEMAFFYVNLINCDGVRCFLYHLHICLNVTDDSNQRHAISRHCCYCCQHIVILWVTRLAMHYQCTPVSMWVLSLPALLAAVTTYDHTWGCLIYEYVNRSRVVCSEFILWFWWTLDAYLGVAVWEYQCYRRRHIMTASHCNSRANFLIPIPRHFMTYLCPSNAHPCYLMTDVHADVIELYV